MWEIHSSNNTVMSYACENQAYWDIWDTKNHLGPINIWVLCAPAIKERFMWKNPFCSKSTFSIWGSKIEFNSWAGWLAEGLDFFLLNCLMDKSKSFNKIQDKNFHLLRASPKADLCKMRRIGSWKISSIFHRCTFSRSQLSSHTWKTKKKQAQEIFLSAGESDYRK